jgi:hypothetical protein
LTFFLGGEGLILGGEGLILGGEGLILGGEGLILGGEGLILTAANAAANAAAVDDLVVLECEGDFGVFLRSELIILLLLHVYIKVKK